MDDVVKYGEDAEVLELAGQGSFLLVQESARHYRMVLGGRAYHITAHGNAPIVTDLDEAERIRLGDPLPSASRDEAA